MDLEAYAQIEDIERIAKDNSIEVFWSSNPNYWEYSDHTDYLNQYDMWNKYVSREDILYIHSRIGG